MLERLEGGDHRSIGRSNEVVREVLADRRRLPALLDGMEATDPLVRMRAADALEKVSAQHHDWLRRYKGRLLNIAHMTGEQEVKWHLAQMAPRLSLTALERRSIVALLKRWLEDDSRIVRVCAMQALFDLSLAHQSMRRDVEGLLRQHAKIGAPSLRARCRKLLQARAE